MSKCLPIFGHIYRPDCKIIMFKVEEQVLSSSEILSLSNFQKICLYFLVGGSSFYGNRLN